MPNDRPHASWLRQVQYERYGHDEPRVCLGDGQTEAQGDLSQFGDALNSYKVIETSFLCFSRFL